MGLGYWHLIRVRDRRADTALYGFIAIAFGVVGVIVSLILAATGWGQDLQNNIYPWS
jgi:hypothetical protein